MIMPFIYRRKIANINRSSKRSDEFIHENVTKTLDDIFHSSKAHSHYIPITAIVFNDPPFDKADPKKFLTLYCIKFLGLSLYEVEHWLDNIAHNEPGKYYLDKVSLVHIDERRRCYKYGDVYRSNICYRPR